MFTRKLRSSAVVLALALGPSAALAQAPNLGKPIDPADIAAWDISILPDGTGLPPGSGTPAQGAPIYARSAPPATARTARAGVNAALVGGGPLTGHRTSAKTIANFWPYRHDPVRLHSPRDAVAAAADADQRRGLRADRLHLALNKLIGENDTMNAQTLPKVQMPNRDGFIVHFPDKI